MFVKMSLFKLAVNIFFKSGGGEGGGQEVGHSKFETIFKKLSDEVSHTATCERQSCAKFISEQKTENRIHFGPTVQELRGFFYSPPRSIFELFDKNHLFFHRNGIHDFSGPMKDKNMKFALTCS